MAGRRLYLGLTQPQVHWILKSLRLDTERQEWGGWVEQGLLAELVKREVVAGEI